LLKTLYPATAALGTLAVVVSVVYRIRNALAVRQHVQELAAEQANPSDPQGVPPTAASEVSGLKKSSTGLARSLARQEEARDEPIRRARRYEYELKQSSRALVVQALHLLTVVVEGMSFSCPAMSYECSDLCGMPLCVVLSAKERF
jgi:hypothetical protein